MNKMLYSKRALQKGDEVVHREEDQPRMKGVVVSSDRSQYGNAKVRWSDGEVISHAQDVLELAVEKKPMVLDYLLNHNDDDLIHIAADFLGFEIDDVNHDTALQWGDGLCDDEINEIHSEMNGGDQ